MPNQIKMKKMIYKILKLFGLGLCTCCGRVTGEIGRFSDDPEDTSGYPDWCHEECYEYLMGKI